MMKKSLIVVGVLVVAGLVGSQVYAQWSDSWGMHRGMMGGGWGYGPMMGPGYYGGPMGYGPGPYSKEFQEKTDKFFNETRGLRQDLRQKYFELESLLSQRTPDESKVLAKQKEISQLRAQLEEKEFQFQLKNPDARGDWYCGGPGAAWGR